VRDSDKELRMRKEAWSVIWVLAAFLLACLCPLGRGNVESSLSDEGDSETAVVSQVEVPRTQEAMKLAQQVIARLRKSYYFLKDTGTGSFQASFSAKGQGLAIGTLKASWEAKTGRVSAKFEGKPGYKHWDWFEQLSWAGLSSSLARSFVPRGLYAAQTDEGYLIADYSPGPSEAKWVRTSVPNNLLQIRKIIHLPNDQENETLWEAKESRGKNYLASMTIIARVPDEPERKVDFTFTYTTRYGPPFVRRLAIEDSGLGEEGSWVLELENVSFVKAEPSEEEQVPRTQEAQDLAREILTKLNESHYSLLQTEIEGFQATFTVQKEGESAGDLIVGWNRNDGQIPTAVKGEGIGQSENWLRGAVEWCMRMTVLSWVSPEEEYPFYAAKKGNRYILDGSDDPTVEAKTMLVSEDFCRLGDVLRYDDGTELDSEYTIETADGKHFVKSMKRTARQPEAAEVKNELTLTYVRRDGFPFLKRVLLDDIGAEGKTSWRLELKDVAFQRKTAPEPEVTKETTVAQKPGPSTEESKAGPTVELQEYPELFEVSIDDEHGYIDKNGELVIPLEFDTAYPFCEGLATVRFGSGVWDYVDHTGKMVIGPELLSVDGKWVVEPKFLGASSFSDGAAAVGTEEGKWRFIDRNGKYIMERSISSYVHPTFCEGLAAVQEGEKWGYIDKKGDFAIRPRFSDADDFSEGLAPVKVSENKWGYINKAGKLVIPAQFWWALAFHEGRAKVQGGKETGHKFGYVDPTGKLVIAYKFDDAEDFSEGLAEVKAGGRETGKWGFIDKAGKWAIQPKFEATDKFSRGLAPVKIGDKWGYIDKSGKYVVEPKYDFAVEFSGSLASVKSGENWLKIDATGKVVWDPTAITMGKALYPIVAGGRWGYIDRLGKVVVQPKFEAADPFFEGLGAVKTGGKWGYLDLTGKIAIQPKFDEAYAFAQGLAPIKLSGKCGFVDKSGKVAIEPKFEDVWSFAEGYAPVKLNGKIGFVDKTGKMVIEPKFDSTYGFAGNVAAVKVGDKWGFVNKAGAVYIEPQYQSVSSFGNGLAAVTTDGKKWGFIHITGTMLIDPQFEDAYRFSEGLAAVKIGGLYGYINEHGEQVIPPAFLTEANPHSEGWAVVKAEEGGQTVVFFISRNILRRQILPKGDKWDEAWAFRDGLAKVKVGDEIGYVNKAGKEVWAPWAIRRSEKKQLELLDEIRKEIEEEEE
jgi:hypothetical protein